MMYSEESYQLAIKECTCCPECSDHPCEGALNWDVSCDRVQCTCPKDDEEDWPND